MVSIFMEKMKQEGFRSMLKNQFIKHTDACVDDFLNGDVKSLFSNTKQLSRLTPSWCAVTDLAKMVADPEEVPPGEAGELDSARVLVRA